LAFVAFARIEFAEGSLTPPDFAAALEQALMPGKSVLRYNRLWRLPQHETIDGWITGRIGFEHPGSESGLWDEQRKDYRNVSTAQLTRYMIAVHTRRVAFELKSSVIKPWTFQGNLQALLNVNDSYQWRVTLEGVAQPPWEEWEQSVSRITNVRIKMERPNPRYPGKQVEELIERAKLSAATIAIKGDSVELSESELLREAFAHAMGGYGAITAKGVVGPDEEKVEWRSEDEGLTEREQVQRDPETQEVSPETLKHLLEQREEANPGPKP
jgi:hypothetical protein